MSLPYLLRLVCLCCASFFLVHGVLGFAAWLATPATLRVARRMRPRPATRLLLCVRLLPVTLAVFAVFALCLPSYLWFEPDTTAERVGLACAAAALLCVGIWVVSISRVFRATVKSLRYARHCRRSGSETRIRGEAAPFLVIPEQSPFMALSGVLRPKIVISDGVLSALSPEQLDAALRHECAHRASHDNLKRLIFLCVPEILPFSHGFAGIERAWARFSEFAADDQAVAGDSLRSVSLAAALVRVARMGAMPHPSPLLAGLIDGNRDLAARVNRLLQVSPRSQTSLTRIRWLLGGVVALGLGVLVAFLLQPQTLYTVHRLLEQFIH